MIAISPAPINRSENQEVESIIIKQEDNLKEDHEETPYDHMPVCPYCKEEMEQMRYAGHMEYFCYWQCGCDDLPDEEVWGEGAE